MTDSGAMPNVPLNGSSDPRSRLQTLVTGTGLQAIAQMSQIIVNIVLTPYVISGLGHERFSIFLLVSSVTAMVANFDGGIGPSAMRFFTLYAGSGDRVARTRLMSTLIAIVIVGSSALFGVILLAAPAILDFFRVGQDLRAESLLMLRAMTVLVGVLLLRNLFNSVLYAHQRFGVTASATILSYGVYAAGMITTVERGWGLYGVTGVLVATQATATIINVPVALRYLDRSSVSWMSRSELTEFTRYAWKVQVSSLLNVTMVQKDQLVAGRVVGAEQSGPYGQGANFAQQLRLLPMNAFAPMQSVIGSDVGRAGARNSLSGTEQLQRLWVRLVAGWVAVAIPVTYFGVRAWLPESFQLAGSVAALLVVGQFFVLAVQVLMLWAFSLGHAELDLRYGLVGALSNVILSLVLFPVWGVMGVIVATVMSQGIAALFLSWHAKRVLKVCPRSFLREVPVAPALVAGLLTWGLQVLAEPFVPSGPLGMLLCAIIAIPPAAFFAWWAVPHDVLARLVGLIRRRR